MSPKHLPLAQTGILSLVVGYTVFLLPVVTLHLGELAVVSNHHLVNRYWINAEGQTVVGMSHFVTLPPGPGWKQS